VSAPARTAAATAARRRQHIQRQIARAVRLLREHAPDMLSARATDQEESAPDGGR
jgi:hypothetical protein